MSAEELMLLNCGVGEDLGIPWTARRSNQSILKKIKGVRQGCILSPCLFNFYAEYTMKNAGLEEAQAGIKIAGRNINNLRYVDDTTLMAKVKKNLRAS